MHLQGQWRAARSGGTRDIIDPFDGSVIRAVDEADPADVDDAIAAARTAFDEGPWPHTHPAARGQLLARVADLLAADRARLAELETRDTGKTLTESGIDVDDVAAVFRYYADLADQRGAEVVATEAAPHTRSVVHREPVGVCAQISPWNYPLLQASWKLAPALAAGNTMVVKPSELTPLSTLRLVELLVEAGLPDGVVNLVLGAGPTVGQRLCESPAVDLVSFTGGIDTGRHVMATAAGTVKRVALELGGKNPNIVFADAPWEAAVDYALLAVFLHAGQVCSAGARLLVEDSVHDAFVAQVAERARTIRLGSGLDPATESGPLISAAHRSKVAGHVEAAVAAGARLLVGGRAPSDPRLANGFFYEPTVLVDVDARMAITREEVFGPVLTVERFHREAEAVALANGTDYGLAGAVWSSDLERAERVAAALRLGTVWVNDYHPYVPEVAWGGFKRSGVGRELGPEGLAEYEEIKHVYVNPAPEPSGWFSTGGPQA